MASPFSLRRELSPQTYVAKLCSMDFSRTMPLFSDLAYPDLTSDLCVFMSSSKKYTLRLSIHTLQHDLEGDIEIGSGRFHLTRPGSSSGREFLCITQAVPDPPYEASVFLALGYLVEHDLVMTPSNSKSLVCPFRTTPYVVLLNTSTQPYSLWLAFDYISYDADFNIVYQTLDNRGYHHVDYREDDQVFGRVTDKEHVFDSTEVAKDLVNGQACLCAAHIRWVSEPDSLLLKGVGATTSDAAAGLDMLQSLRMRCRNLGKLAKLARPRISSKMFTRTHLGTQGNIQQPENETDHYPLESQSDYQSKASSGINIFHSNGACSSSNGCLLSASKSTSIETNPAAEPRTMSASRSEICQSKDPASTPSSWHTSDSNTLSTCSRAAPSPTMVAPSVNVVRPLSSTATSCEETRGFFGLPERFDLVMIAEDINKWDGITGFDLPHVRKNLLGTRTLVGANLRAVESSKVGKQRVDPRQDS